MHEVRVPFNAMLLGVEQLQHDIEPFQHLLPDALETINILEQQAEAISHILNDVLSLQQIEDGIFELRPRLFHLDSLLRATLVSFKAPCQERHMNIKMRLAPLDPTIHQQVFKQTKNLSPSPLPSPNSSLLSPTLRYSLYGDAQRIRQVLSHLVSNSIKFGLSDSEIHVFTEYTKLDLSPSFLTSLRADPSGISWMEQEQEAVQAEVEKAPMASPTTGVEEDASPTYPSTSPSASPSPCSPSQPFSPSSPPLLYPQIGTVRLQVTVRDQGAGVSDEERAGLFKSEMHIHEAGTLQKKKGSGLGLALSKSIMELMPDGKLGYKPAKHRDGSSGSDFFFTCTLPICLEPVPAPSRGPSLCSTPVAAFHRSIAPNPAQPPSPVTLLSPSLAGVLTDRPREALSQPDTIASSKIQRRARAFGFGRDGEGARESGRGGKSMSMDMVVPSPINRPFNKSQWRDGEREREKEKECGDRRKQSGSLTPSQRQRRRTRVRDSDGCLSFDTVPEFESLTPLSRTAGVLEGKGSARESARAVAPEPAPMTSLFLPSLCPSPTVAPSHAPASSSPANLRISIPRTGAADGDDIILPVAQAGNVKRKTSAASVYPHSAPPAPDQDDCPSSIDGRSTAGLDDDDAPLLSSPSMLQYQRSAVVLNLASCRSRSRPLLLNTPTSRAINSARSSNSTVRAAANLEPLTCTHTAHHHQHAPSTSRNTTIVTHDHGGGNSSPATPTNHPLSRQVTFTFNNSNVINKRVLVVEDSLPNRKLLCSLLKRLGCVVNSCENGRECLEKFQPHFAALEMQMQQQQHGDNTNNADLEPPFDVIVMDNTMPEMDGVTCSRLLRSRGVKIPIIGVTGNALQEDLEKFAQAGANLVLTKPVSSQQLLSALEKHCAAGGGTGGGGSGSGSGSGSASGSCSGLGSISLPHEPGTPSKSKMTPNFNTYATIQQTLTQTQTQSQPLSQSAQYENEQIVRLRANTGTGPPSPTPLTTLGQLQPIRRHLSFGNHAPTPIDAQNHAAQRSNTPAQMMMMNGRGSPMHAHAHGHGPSSRAITPIQTNPSISQFALTHAHAHAHRHIRDSSTTVSDSSKTTPN